MPPQLLDRYLARGWFRMGQTIFTCHFLNFKNNLYTAIWTRLDLQGYTFRKSLRKIINRNNQRFKTVFRKAVFDQDKERLYRIHRSRFEGYVTRTLRESLQGDARTNIYNTYEFCVYDEDQLVATSFFDLGKNSVASIMGLFDPDYGSYSLGFYTMLMEIHFAQEHQMDFYYPGYVVPGYKRFDYKLRIGGVEFFDARSNEWLPYNQLSEEHLFSRVLQNKLSELNHFLLDYNFPIKLTLYPLYDKKLFGVADDNFIRSPLFLNIYPDNPNAFQLIVEYNLFEQVYQIKEVFRLDDAYVMIQKLFEDYDKETSCLNFLMEEHLLLETNNYDTLAKVLSAYGRDHQLLPPEK